MYTKKNIISHTQKHTHLHIHSGSMKRKPNYLLLYLMKEIILYLNFPVS